MITIMNKSQFSLMDKDFWLSVLFETLLDCIRFALEYFDVMIKD
jgi:hypothetical protein